MRLLALEVEQLRNLEHVLLEPAPGATIAVGANGQGKTNLLEAIYFLCTLKPLRASRLAELVRFGASRARVRGRFLLHGAEREISTELENSQRVSLVDGKKASSLEAYFGGVSVVAFTPDDLEVVKGGPAHRRWLLDRAVFNRFPVFLKESRAYARAVKSRNRLLKEGASAAYLSAYDETLASTGARVLLRRAALLAELEPGLAEAFRSIASPQARATFRYDAGVLTSHLASEEGALTQRLLAELQRRTSEDQQRGFTSVGPHADDVDIALDDRPARLYASQGQQRALVLAWKLAEIANLRSAHGFLPLLLLDDVSSELDPARNALLMDYIAQSGAQVFMTTTDPTLVRRAAGPNSAWLEVLAGSVRPLKGPPSEALDGPEFHNYSK